MASPSAFPPSSADAEIDNRPLLLAMFSALKDLYEHVEARALADLGAEVVDALAMCQHDFQQLVARLRDDPTPARGASPRAALPVGGASPLAQRLEPPRGSPPTSPNSQMLEQLSSLNMDQLQEAARYFSLAEPAEGLVARSRHEARYLQQAAVEGREAAARRFLVTLERMTKQAGVRQPDEWAAALQEPPADETPLLELPISLADASPAALDEAMRSEADGAWKQPRNRRSGRRRRLWPADDDGTSGEQDSTAGSIGRRSPAPGSTASLAPSGAEAAGGGLEDAPPRANGGEEEAALAEGGGEARREEDGRVATRRDANAPLPAWTSWGEEEAAHPPAARRRKKRAPPPASFLPSSLPSPPRAEAAAGEAGGEEARGAAGGGEAAEAAVALRRVPSGGECVLELSACGWSSRSFAAVVRGAEAEGGEAGGEESAGGNSPNGVSEGGGRREKLRSPERKTAAELLEITQARHARAEATRELRAAEEASRIEKKRSREAQVRERNQRLSVEKKKALDEKMLRAEAAREANVTSKASRARLENQKVEEIAFINSINELHNATPKEQRKDAITQRMEEAAARRELQHERMVSANAARESAAVERHRLLLQQQHAKVRSSGPRADEAYLRWLDFTRTVSQRAAEKNAKHRSEVLERREVQQRAAQLEVESRKAALNQRMAEANARRLAHIELLLQQARIASERHAAVQQAREARRTAWSSEWERSESADNESGGDGAARRRHARGASARRKQTGSRVGARGDVYSASGDENRSESSRSGASQSGGTPAVELEAGGPLSEHEEESERNDSPASPLRHFDEGGESPRERRGAESGADGPAIIIPPTIAALAVVEPAGAAEGGLRRPHTASNAVSPLRNLHEKAQAAEAAQQEAEREQLRRLRARAKKVRQRMAATAATVRLEQLEQLWSSSALIANSNGSSTQSSKRILRLINSLAQVAAQPQSDGAEATVIELVKLLENGRERELHAIRTHGGFEHLLALATAGTAADSGAITVAPRRSTQTGALRALLAACALPCNRTYLLLRNYTDRLAFQLLPSAVMAEATAGRTCPPDVLRPTDAPLLPLLKLLRLVIATAPPIEAGRRLQSDLVVVLRFSGGLGALQRYCASCSSTIALAMQHEALLLQYIALLHALLIPVRMDPTCTCAAPLCSFLEESGLGGIPGLLCTILYEASQPAAPSSYWPADEAPRPPAGPSVPLLRLCRCAVQLLVHIGSVPLDPPRSPPAPSLLARVLGSGELKVQTFHLAHLALQLCEDVDPHGAGIPAADDDGPPLPSRQPAAGGVSGEMRALTHDVVMLLGLFCLRSRANCEVLRWRWGQHQLMLHRLCSLRFGYFVVPALREVLLPTLICGCMHDAVNLRVLAAKLSPSHLLRYLELAMASQQPSTPRTAGAAGDSCTPAALMSDPSELPVVYLDFSLAARLPPALWSEAFDFLSSVPEAPAAAEAELCDSGEGVVLEATALSVTSSDSTFFPPPLAALCTG